jgi:hypothetical protein
LWKYIFECFLMIFLMKVMMKLFLFLIILFLFTMFLWIKLMPNSLNGMTFSLLLSVRILDIVSFFCHIHHLGLIICDFLLELSFFLLLVFLFIKLFLIFFFILFSLFLLLQGLFDKSHKELNNIENAFLMTGDNISSFNL